MTARTRVLLRAAVTAQAEDALLSADQAAALVGISAKNWAEYARRWSALVGGARVVRVRPGSRGRMRWLRSAIVQHMREELLHPELDSGGIPGPVSKPKGSAPRRTKTERAGKTAESRGDSSADRWTTSPPRQEVVSRAPDA